MSEEKPAGVPTTNEPMTPLEKARRDITENRKGWRDRAARWWKMNRIDRKTQAEVVELERAEKHAVSVTTVCVYINAYEDTLPASQRPMDKSVAAEMYAAEIDRIRGKQKEVEDWATSDSHHGGVLSPHSKFQSWSVLEGQLLTVMSKMFQARGVEMASEDKGGNLSDLPAAVRKELYDALEKSKRLTLTETKREITLGGRDERADAGPTPASLEADKAPE